MDYQIVYGDHQPFFTQFLVGQLVSELQEHDFGEEWRGCIRALLWIFWVLVTSSARIDARSWAEDTLLESLEHRHGQHSNWPEGWQEREWELCCGFVWSHQELRKPFDIFCEKITNTDYEEDDEQEDC